MEDLLKNIQALDQCDQQKLLSSLISSASPDLQLSLLFPSINAASSYVKWRLVTLCTGQDTPDLFTLLPPELQVSILAYVDGTSLLQASQVSKEWNRVIKSQNQIWFKKCKELGVNVERINSGSNWHHIYVSSMRQQLCMKNGTAFTERFMQLQNCKKAVKAVDYQHGYLCTVSEEDYVNIWQLELNIPVLAFSVQRAVSCIKFKPNSFLVCGHFVGILTSWDLSVMTDHSCIVYDSINDSPGEITLLKCKFKMHAGPVFSCDFSKDLDLVVSGGADECIKLWCLTSGLLVKSLPNQDHWVLRVILLPDLTYMFEHVIICMTRDNVCKICWPSGHSDELNNDKDSIDEKENKIVNQMGNLNKILFQSRIQRNEGNNNFFTPGLQQSTKFVGLIKQDIDEKHANICIYDIKTFQIVHNITLKFKVKKLLALGNRFALLLTIGNALYSSTLVAVDIVTGVTVGTHPVPHSKMTTPDGAQLVVGDTDWLDGLRGYVPDDISHLRSSNSSSELSNKNQNLASSLPSMDQLGNSNNCSLATSPVCNDNRVVMPDDADHNLPCCSSSNEAGSPEPGPSGGSLHVENNNFNATSNFPEVLPLNRSKNVAHVKMRLERPSHLVLAAGVQCEPGRLFTLWWSNYKIISKYKEE